MADIKLDLNEQALYEEVGSRGDYFRAATADRAAQQVNVTGRMSEITTEAGNMVDEALGPNPVSTGETVTEVVPPSDLSSVVGKAPGNDPVRPGWPNKDTSGA